MEIEDPDVLALLPAAPKQSEGGRSAVIARRPSRGASQKRHYKTRHHIDAPEGFLRV